MKQMIVIYDIGFIKSEFIRTAVHWTLEPHRMFFTWLVANLETLYCVVPAVDTLSRMDYAYLSIIDNRFDQLSTLLYQQIQIPKFTGDYRFHVKLINDDLFLIFN